MENAAKASSQVISMSGLHRAMLLGHEYVIIYNSYKDLWPARTDHERNYVKVTTYGE